MPLITVFTPTYNRAYILTALYDSLKRQSCQDFEWVIVDDGSTDNTEELISSFKKENIVPINYKRIDNGGKPCAINFGSDMAKGEFFFIVDSDDYLTNDAIEIINAEVTQLPETFTGVCYRCKFQKNGEMVGTDFPQRRLESNHLELVTKYKHSGDKAEVYRTSLLQKYKFPVLIGEKFVPESYLWSFFATLGPMLYINEAIYCCEYIADGYTANLIANRDRNKMGFIVNYCSYLSKELSMVIRFKYLLKALFLMIKMFLQPTNKRKGKV